MKNKLLHYLKRLFSIIRKPEFKVLPGQVAYFIVLSLIPLMSLIGIIASKFSVSITDIVNIFNGVLPKEILDFIVPALNSPSFGAGLSVVFGFFIASNSMTSFILASNMLFKIEDGNYFLRRLKAIFMLIVFIFLLLFVIVVMTYGTNIIDFIYSLAFKESAPKVLTEVFLLCKWTVGIIVMYFMMKIIFTMAPNADIPSRAMSKGAVFTTIAWLVATYLFSLYVNNFSNYNLFYSSLANLVILMIWIYILSYSLVIGIAINSDAYLSSLDKTKKKKKKA